MIGSEETAPGVIIQDDHDRLLIGAFPNPNVSASNVAAAAQSFVNIYAKGGKTDCKLSENVLHDRWRKLVYNACLNPICAILGLDTGRLRLAANGEVVEGLVRPAMKEIVEAAKANGVTLGEEVVQGMIDSDPLEKYLSPSMLADVKKVSLCDPFSRPTFLNAAARCAVCSYARGTCRVCVCTWTSRAHITRAITSSTRTYWASRCVKERTLGCPCRPSRYCTIWRKPSNGGPWRREGRYRFRERKVLRLDL